MVIDAAAGLGMRHQAIADPRPLSTAKDPKITSA
jgi:hypothetical protein